MIRFLPRTQILSGFAAMLSLMAILLAGPAAADTRAVYTITGIPVDERAESTIQAQENAFAAARLIAARALIEKITLAEDRGVAGGVPVDPALASRLAAAVDIIEESRGGGRYRGRLSVVLNPLLVRDHLKSLGVPYVDQQAPLALVVVQEGSALASVMMQGDAGALAPYRVTASPLAYEDGADFFQLARMAGAQRVIVAREVASGPLMRADLFLSTPNGLTPLGATDLVTTPGELPAAIGVVLDTAWKQQAIIRSDSQTQVTATVRYTSIAEWVALREALARSTLVSQFRTEAVARDGAVVRFAFAGDAERLRSDLLQRGVTLETDPAGWVLRSAGAGVRAPVSLQPAGAPAGQ